MYFLAKVSFSPRRCLAAIWLSILLPSKMSENVKPNAVVDQMSKMHQWPSLKVHEELIWKVIHPSGPSQFKGMY
jgi:hypothetical protein